MPDLTSELKIEIIENNNKNKDDTENTNGNPEVSTQLPKIFIFSPMSTNTGYE